jgi:NAD-dependent SIR2 family protein deacetylase
VQPATDSGTVDELSEMLARHARWFVLTGAGCSTESGIPAYRDETGRWQHRQPIRFREFVESEAVQRRYWARSLIGYERVRSAQPNRAHHALARLERLGKVVALVTQNVDDLHRRAGSRSVIDLHGRVSLVECLGCRRESHRDELQTRLRRSYPASAAGLDAEPAPDGDALAEEDGAGLSLPRCGECGGVLKPAVVFFGETVPPERVVAAYADLGRADALLVVGSSLAVFSGYRFVRRAADRGLPIAVVNAGVTRADALAALKVEGSCGPALDEAVGALAQRLGWG